MTPHVLEFGSPDTGVLLLDASCLLNLYATGLMGEIAAAIPWRLGVTEYVLEQEVQYVRTFDEPGNQEGTVKVDLSSLIDDGLLWIMRPQNLLEQAAFVDLAALIDDGEAMTGAIALCRGYSVAIDDRKARRVLRERAPEVTLVSTLEVMHRWSASAPIQELQRALQAMRRGASYIPGNRDPLYTWWRDMAEDLGAH